MCYEIHSSASGTMKILYSRLKRTAANSSAKVALQFFIEHFCLLSTAEMGGAKLLGSSSLVICKLFGLGS